MKKNNKGFSLVELIVVIAIMGVLVVVLAPTYLRYVNKTKLEKDIAAVGEVYEAIKVSTAEEKVMSEVSDDTESEGKWTYILIDGSGDGKESTITAIGGGIQKKDAPNLQEAIQKTVGSSLSFERKEVQDVKLYLLVAMDANYKANIKLDASNIEDATVRAAFEKAFPGSGMSLVNRKDLLDKKIAEKQEEINKYREQYGEQLDAATALSTEILSLETQIAIADSTTLENAVNTAKSALAAFGVSKETAISNYQNATGLKKLAYAAAYAAAMSVDEAEQKLEHFNNEKQQNIDALNAKQQEYDTNYKEIVDGQNKLLSEYATLEAERQGIWLD